MPQYQNELLTGVVDGVNTVFFSSLPYTAGTMAVSVDGQLQFHPAGNPWTESDPGTGEVTLLFSPKAGSVVSGAYSDTTPILPETVIQELDGSVCFVNELSAGIEQTTELSGTLDDAEELEGSIGFVTELDGKVEQTEFLVGEISICE